MGHSLSDCRSPWTFPLLGLLFSFSSLESEFREHSVPESHPFLAGQDLRAFPSRNKSGWKFPLLPVVDRLSDSPENFNYLFFFLWPHPRAFGTLVPRPGSEPGPWQWKHRVLTIGPPGNSQPGKIWHRPGRQPKVAGQGGGGMNWEIGIDMYTLIYIKWITNKNLLYKK